MQILGGGCRFISMTHSLLLKATLYMLSFCFLQLYDEFSGGKITLLVTMMVKMDTCITLIGRPVSFASVSRMCLVGFGVYKELYKTAGTKQGSKAS